MPSNTEARWTSYSGGWHGSYSYRYDRTLADGTYICELINNSGGVESNFSISFVPSTGVWHDHGNNNPVYLTSTSTFASTTSTGGNPTRLWLWENSTNLRLEVDTPSWSHSSGSGGGGGTNTEGDVTFGVSGNKFINANDQLVFTIDSISPTSNATIVYKIFQNSSYAYTVNHTTGTVTEFNVGDPNDAYWELRLESTNSDYDSQVLASFGGRRKVSCNFW